MNRSLFSPQFLRPLSGMMEVGEGESILLEVRVHGRPLPEVEWFRNGQEIKMGLNSTDQGHHELRIPRVTQNHTGEYRCSAVNSSGRVSSALWVAVVPTKGGGVKKSQSMDCDNTAGRTGTFYFENPLSNKPVQRQMTDDPIYRPGYRQIGSKPRNRDGNAPTSPRRRAPGFVTRPSATNLTPGSKLSLKARLLGYPQPKVTWEKNGSTLSEDDDRIRLVADGNNTHVIEIESVNYSDSGVYKIIARNPLGRQHAQALVSVSNNGPTSGPVDLPANQRSKVTSWQNYGRQSATSTAVTPPKPPPSPPGSDKATDNYFALSRDVETASSTSSRSLQSLQVSLEAVSVNSKYSENSKISDNSFSPSKLPLRKVPDPIAPVVVLPVVLESLEDKSCAIGDYVTLECRISGGKGDPMWKFNDARELPNGTVFRNFGELYRLRIRGLQEAQFGEYSIIVKNEAGEISNACQISNIQPPSPPALVKMEVFEDKILTEKHENIQSAAVNRLPSKPPTVIAPLRDITAYEGEIIELEARITGVPRPTVRFFFEDERFVSDEGNGIIVVHDGDVHRLILEEVSTDDSGNYSVVARNSLTGEQVQSHCTVTVKQKEPAYIHVPSEIRVRRGESVSIEVESDATELVWSYDEQYAQPIEPGRFAFNIARVQRGGSVNVVAKNDSGSITSRTNIVVIEPPPVPAKFTVELPSEMEVVLNQSIPLTVQYSGIAKTIKWTLNGQSLPPLFDVSSNPSEDGGLSQVFIQSMRIDMEGELTCTISNDSGIKKSSCILSYVRVPPEFTSTPVESLVVYVGSALVMGCEFGGVPVPSVTWMKDGAVVTRGDVTENEAVSKLEVSDVTMEDGGQYLVKIENVAGIAQYSIQVVIREQSPEITLSEVVDVQPAEIVERLKDKTFAEGEDIVLRCRVDGKPIPTVHWYLGDELIWEGPPDEGGLSELILKDCWSEDMGQYRITATNSQGQDESCCNVIVQQRLKPMMDIQGPIEPMETILEVSEHSRTTSADSHRTETQNEDTFHEEATEDRTCAIGAVLGEPLLSSTGYPVHEQTTVHAFDGTTFTVEGHSDDISEPTSLQSSDDQQTPCIVTHLTDTVVNDGEKNFHWKMCIINSEKVEVFKQGESGLMEEMNLDGTDFSLVKNNSNYSIVFNEIFPDDAGVYKIVGTNSYGEVETTAQLSVVPLEGVEPKVVIRPRSKEVTIGEKAVFFCTVEGDPPPEIIWNIGNEEKNSETDSRVKITKVPQDNLLRSEIEISHVKMEDIGRAHVIANNILAEAHCPFSILLASGEQPGEVQTDFRSQLRNKVTTKAVTADDLQTAEVHQFDFRSNLKKSRTSENLADMCDEDGYEFESCVTSELGEKLANRLTRSEVEPQTTFHTAEAETSFHTAEAMDLEPKVVDETILGQMGTEILNKSRNSVYSLASSSSKASTVHPLVTDGLSDSKDGSASSGMEADLGQKPKFVQELTDTTVMLGETFSLVVKIDNAEEVVWTLESEEIEAEPEEGLIIKSEGPEHTLLVMSSLMEDMGTYNVIAKNAHGVSRSHCFVTIFNQQ